MKFPVCVFVMLNTGGLAIMVVKSVALALAEPPPDTLTAFTCGDGAFPATITTTVIGG